MTERKTKFQAIKGTRDILPPDSALWNWFEATARRVMESCAFREIRLPIFEQTELFARSVGEDTDIVNKEMYPVSDPDLAALKRDRQLILSDEVEDTDDPEVLSKYVLKFEIFFQFVRQGAQEGIVPLEENEGILNSLEREVGRWSYKKKNFPPGKAEWLAYVKKVKENAAALDLGEQMSLRPEATASVVRAYIEHGMHTQPGLVKLYYLGPMFRRERPQKGRYRQFYQVGAEVLSKAGADANADLVTDARVDAELIEMLTVLLGECGVERWTLLVNSIGCGNCRPKYVQTLRSALEPVKARMCADCQRRAETNALRVLDCKVEADQPIIAKLPAITDHLDEPCRAHFEEFQRQLKLREIPYTIAPRLVRGLDYYRRTTFEITSPPEVSGLGAQNALVGGGRYDGLSELLGGPPAKGIGFALGTDRFIEAIKDAGKVNAAHPVDVYVAWMGAAAYAPAVKLARRLRGEGFTVELPPEEMKLKKSLGLASRIGGMGARYALILGENEVASGRYALKRLADAVQKEYAEDELVAFLKKEKEKH